MTRPSERRLHSAQSILSTSGRIIPRRSPTALTTKRCERLPSPAASARRSLTTCWSTAMSSASPAMIRMAGQGRRCSGCRTTAAGCAWCVTGSKVGAMPAAWWHRDCDSVSSALHSSHHPRSFHPAARHHRRRSAPGAHPRSPRLRRQTPRAFDPNPRVTFATLPWLPRRHDRQNGHDRARAVVGVGNAPGGRHLPPYVRPVLQPPRSVAAERARLVHCRRPPRRWPCRMHILSC